MNILDMVELEWQEEFLKFIKTGKASNEFYKYLDNCENCQKAFDIKFDEKSKDIINSLKIMKGKILERLLNNE